MTKPVWRTYSIRVNPKTRKAVGLQTRIPLTPEEWNALMAWLTEHKNELVDCGCDPDGPEYHCNDCGLRHPDHQPDCQWLKQSAYL